MKLPSVGVVIAMVGTALSTENEEDVAAVNGLPAKSDHAELPIEMVGEPSPVQLVRLTTAVVAEVTFTDFVQVAPLPLKVMAESSVAPTSDVGFASAKVRVKLLAMEEVTVDTAGDEIVTVGSRISTLKEFVAVVVKPDWEMDAITECWPGERPVTSTDPLKSAPVQDADPVIAPPSMVMETISPAAEQVP